MKQTLDDTPLNDTPIETLWQVVPPHETRGRLVHTATAQPHQNTEIYIDDPRIRASFNYYAQALQHEYIYHYVEPAQPARIEPTRGYVVTSGARLIPESMPHYWDVGFPLLDEYRKIEAAGARRIVKEAAVISLREFGDINYYHFHNDVLGKLALLERHGIGVDWPLVVSKALGSTTYFQGVLRRSRVLRERRWIVQDEFFVEADEIVFCKVMPHVKSNFEFVLDALDVSPGNGDRRIFLTRNPIRKRFIENAGEVEDVCVAYGFEIVDSDDLTLDEQIKFFSEARFVIGIHGAGLTNIMFRRPARGSLLEIFPPTNIPPHYFWLSRFYDFDYDALLGSNGKTESGFQVDPRLLGSKLERLLAAESR